MTTYTSTYDEAQRLHSPKTVNAASPFQWLRDGWRDLRAAPTLSALFGLIFTVACVLAYSAASALPLFSAAFLTLLLTVSPFIAAAAYFVARQHEHGNRPSLRNCITSVKPRTLGIGLFSLLCAVVVAAWLRLTGITFALYYGTLGTSAAEVARVWTAGDGAPAMLAFIALASTVLALILFAVGALSLPMIADRNTGVIEAVHTSVRTLWGNKTAVVVWMLLLSMLIGVALVSGLVLMPLVFPLLAYAIWHSYRRLSTGQ